MTAPLGLTPAEAAFVEHLLDLGDANAAAATAGVQPSLALDPRIQSAIIEQIRNHGAVDAVLARKTLRELAQRAENEGVRYRAATTLWERGLGKVPDTIQVDVSIQHVSRSALYAEIRNLIDEVGLPPMIEGEFEELADNAAERHAPQLNAEAPPAGAMVAEAAPPPRAGSSPAAGTTPQPDAGRALPGAYIPELPTKWR